MRIGILADVHEDVEGLAAALALLKREAADLLVVLGDVFDSGKRIGETVALLAEAGAVGVWGNHELGLCHKPSERIRSRYAGLVLDFMGTLRPRLEADGCLFSHGLPCWDAPSGSRGDPSAVFRASCGKAAQSRGLTTCHRASRAILTTSPRRAKFLLSNRFPHPRGVVSGPPLNQRVVGSSPTRGTDSRDTPDTPG
jgi:hypothetical protein